MPQSIRGSELSLEIADQLRDALSAGKIELPILPEAASQILAMAGDANCSARDLVEVIKRDQSIMAHLMRMANSVLFAPEIPIVSLQLAVSRLGMAKVRDIALAAALKSKVFKPGRHGNLVRAYFRSALATAAFSQEVARMRRRNVELAFLAGLLVNVSSPLICQNAMGDELTETEMREVVVQIGPEFSSILIESWGLPAALINVAKNQKDPSLAGDDRDLCASVHLGAELSAWALSEEDSDMVFEDAAGLNLYPDDVAKLKARREAVMALVESAL